MKKLLIIVALFFVVIGCGKNMATPTSKVEEFLGKYQTMDSTVLTQLDSVISTDEKMSDEQKKEYRSLMERQYQNLSYKIKSEEIDGDTATVDVEIEVYDYAASITKSKNYYAEHKDEFKDDNKDNDQKAQDEDESNEVVGGAVEDAADAVKDMFEETTKYIDYKIKQLKDVTDKAKYDMTFYLRKDKNDEWILEDISDIDRQKIHGLYEK